MTRLAPLLAVVALAGCFDFKGELKRCVDEGRCPNDGGGGGGAGGGGGTGGALGPAAGLCSQGLCWENPFPVAVPLLAVYAEAPDDVYAVGAFGTALHLHGGAGELSFLERPTPPDVTWRAVTSLAGCSFGVAAMSPNQALYQFTDAGLVQRSAGLGYQSVAQGWTAADRTCSFVGNFNGAPWYVEEAQGQLVSREPTQSPTDWQQMRALGGTSRDDLWLLGDRFLFSRVPADGGWQRDPDGRPDGGFYQATGVCTLGPGDVYVSTADGVLSRAAGWAQLGDVRRFRAVACAPPDGVYAAADGLVRRCSKAAGTCTDLTTDEDWAALHASDAGVLVGSSTGDLAWVGPSGLTRISRGTREPLYDVTVGPDGDGWAVGRNATVLRRSDGGWHPFDAGFFADETVYGVAALRDGRVVFAGAGGALRVVLTDGGIDKPLEFLANGTVVQNQQLGFDFNAVREVGGVAYALGDNNVLLSEAPNGTWHALYSLGSNRHFYDMAETDAGRIFLAASGTEIDEFFPDAGTLVILRGPAGGGSALTTITQASDGTVWFGGSGALGVRLDPDGGLQPFNLPGNFDTIVGYLEQADALYVVGTVSLYRHIGGAPPQWEIVGPLPAGGSTARLSRLAATRDDFFAVGGSGTIVRVNRAGWLHRP